MRTIAAIARCHESAVSATRSWRSMRTAQPSTCTTIIASYERDRFTSRNGTRPSSEIDNARETSHSSHGGDEGLGAMADRPSSVLTRRLADDREKKKHPDIGLVRGGAGGGALPRLDRRTEA